jgi:thioredoxin reductase
MSEFRRSLPRASFDLAIVGGGVHGLFAALEPAPAQSSTRDA